MNMSIIYGYTIEDNIPVKFKLMPPHQETYFENALKDLEINNITYYQWNKASDSDILEYTDNLECLCNEKLYELLLCYDLNYKDKSHV